MYSPLPQAREPRTFSALVRTYFCVLAMIRNGAQCRGYAAAETYYQRVLVFTDMILAIDEHTVALHQPVPPPPVSAPLSRHGARTLRMLAKVLLRDIGDEVLRRRNASVDLALEVQRSQVHIYSILFTLTESR